MTQQSRRPKTAGFGLASGPSAEARKPAEPPPGEFTDREQEVAQVIRTAYVEARSSWESLQRGVAHDYRPTRKEDEGHHERADGKAKDVPPVWLTLARGFLRHGLDPEDYVFAAFERALKLKKAPEARQLLAPTYLAAYAEERRRSVDAREVEIFLNTEKAIARRQIGYLQSYCGMSVTGSHHFVLTDESLELSALFRYCVACHLLERTADQKARRLFAEVAATYKAAAVAQYARDRAEYDQHWAGFLPRGFAEEAARVLRRARAEARKEWEKTRKELDGEEEE